MNRTCGGIQWGGSAPGERLGGGVGQMLDEADLLGGMGGLRVRVCMERGRVVVAQMKRNLWDGEGGAGGEGAPGGLGGLDWVSRPPILT